MGDNEQNKNASDSYLEFDEDGDDELERSDSENNHTVMSIFASYYGIEDEAKKSSLSIDSPQFDATQYVTELLSNHNIEYVTTRNLNLIQEIRVSKIYLTIVYNYYCF